MIRLKVRIMEHTQMKKSLIPWAVYQQTFIPKRNGEKFFAH